MVMPHLARRARYAVSMMPTSMQVVRVVTSTPPRLRCRARVFINDPSTGTAWSGCLKFLPGSSQILSMGRVALERFVIVKIHGAHESNVFANERAVGVGSAVECHGRVGGINRSHEGSGSGIGNAGAGIQPDDGKVFGKARLIDNAATCNANVPHGVVLHARISGNGDIGAAAHGGISGNNDSAFARDDHLLAPA